MNYLNTQIVIEPGLMENLGSLISEGYPGKRIMVISDETVYAVYGPKLEQQLQDSELERTLLVLPTGENSKTMDSLALIYKELLRNRFTRDDVIVAFGGGAIGDVTGMAASTYLRGIPFAHVPTTLVAQADSCLGGKNGINLPEGRNLIGTFHNPDYIWIDPLFLKTLNDTHFASGMAEIIKYACIADRELLESLQSIDDITDTHVIESVIQRCVEIKMMFLDDKDPDNEQQMILNFGHTIGHGIENYYDYDQYSHGEAVALGMKAITESAEEQGLTAINTSAMMDEVLSKYGLPTTLPSSVDKERLFKMTLHDKKHRGDRIDLILLKKIGTPYIHTVNHSELEQFI